MLLPECSAVLQFPLKDKLVYFFIIQSHSNVQDREIMLPDPLLNEIYVAYSSILDQVLVLLCNQMYTFLTTYTSIGSLHLLYYHLNDSLSSVYNFPGPLYPRLWHHFIFLQQALKA